MSEIPGPAPGWDKVEPPDYDLEPSMAEEYQEPDDAFDGEYISPSQAKEIRELLSTAEHIDGLAEVDLFQNVVVTSSDGELKFEVPPRIIETAQYGNWLLEVSGKRKWFKERSDYGEVRFLRNGRSIWVPHLYAFEGIDEDNIPSIRDRERLNVEITLRRLPGEGRSPYPMAVRVDTLNGEYGAVEEIGRSYGSNTLWFLEFVHVGGTLAAYDVNHPDVERPSVTDYLGTLYGSGQADKAKRLLRGQEELPPEFRFPEPEIMSEKSDLTGALFGELWVPVELLRRREVYAKISFPDFQKS